MKQNHPIYCTFRGAVCEKFAYDEIVSSYLKKVNVKNDGCVDVLFF